MNFIVLQLNVRSILAHQMDLKTLLNELDKQNGKADILLLSETFLSKKMEKLVNINGYTALYNPCTVNKGVEHAS